MTCLMESRMRRKSHVRFGERGSGIHTGQPVRGATAPTPRDPAPSADDGLVTEQLAAAGRLREVPVHDHVILGRGRYLSFAEAGLL
jgi:hypothetical protein